MPPENKQTPTLPITQQSAPDPAEKLLAAKRKRVAEEKKREQKELNDKFVHYLRCPRVKEHVAAFLTEHPKPGLWLTPGHWYSQFRKIGEPHQVPFIRCQECQLEGERRPWIVALNHRRRQDLSYEFQIQDGLRESVLGKMPRAEAEAEMSKKEVSRD